MSLPLDPRVSQQLCSAARAFGNSSRSSQTLCGRVCSKICKVSLAPHVKVFQAALFCCQGLPGTLREAARLSVARFVARFVKRAWLRIWKVPSSSALPLERGCGWGEERRGEERRGEERRGEERRRERRGEERRGEERRGEERRGEERRGEERRGEERRGEERRGEERRGEERRGEERRGEERRGEERRGEERRGEERRGEERRGEERRGEERRGEERRGEERRGEERRKGRLPAQGRSSWFGGCQRDPEATSQQRPAARRLASHPLLLSPESANTRGTESPWARFLPDTVAARSFWQRAFGKKLWNFGQGALGKELWARSGQKAASHGVASGTKEQPEATTASGGKENRSPKAQWSGGKENESRRRTGAGSTKEQEIAARFGHGLQQDLESELAARSKQLCSVARACLELFKKQPDSLWQGCSKTWNASF